MYTLQYGERIAHLREENGLTQEELSIKIGISRAALSHYEKNRRQPDYDTIRKLADFFGVSVDYVLGHTNIRETPEKVIDNALQDDPELMAIWLEIKNREDLQSLFREVKPMTPENVKKVIRIIKALEEEKKEG
ncbi:MAG: helix-turn-helix domain-containing protein [Firmicutes bacterium]|nr:helix-turn-helix domain-containing protein [Bacillota bacterium]